MTCAGKVEDRERTKHHEIWKFGSYHLLAQADPALHPKQACVDEAPLNPATLAQHRRLTFHKYEHRPPQLLQTPSCVAQVEHLFVAEHHGDPARWEG